MRLFPYNGIPISQRENSVPDLHLLDVLQEIVPLSQCKAVTVGPCGCSDKRYHIVEELYKNEREYVEALRTLKDSFDLCWCGQHPTGQQRSTILSRPW
ncbi:hypothetical protein RRG08_039701 [Elysia crispata]|uniref:DH domain-containing protein n=1 Tax=Elysia crispata TaxID=231223 RepID=A0AAE1CVN0_9GAST|nr:hypothetical protein RRG08_039701 [Elysia crispata]